MSGAGVTLADVGVIEGVALEVRAVGAVLCKLGEAPGSLDSEIASWLGGVLIEAVARLSQPHERLTAIARGEPS